MQRPLREIVQFRLMHVCEGTVPIEERKLHRIVYSSGDGHYHDIVLDTKLASLVDALEPIILII